MKNISRDKLIDMYRTMIKIRKFEETAVDLFAKKILRGNLHSYIGQEAVAVGVCAVLSEKDIITSTHRGHGHCIAKGGKLDRMMAELFGKKTGYCKGKGGSMHIADHSVGILGANGIVGAGIPIAVGVALSIKYKKSNEVVVCFFGDGAANQGAFHEGINLASIWKLPVIFICENNLYALSTAQSKVMNPKDISVRASSYEIPGITVDGNDVIAVYNVTDEAVSRARDGFGPSLIECKTYRFRGHWEGDMLLYRTKEESDSWREKCPIERIRNYLIREKIIDDEKDSSIKREVEIEVESAVEFSYKSDFPSVDEIYDDVYVTNFEESINQ